MAWLPGPNIIVWTPLRISAETFEVSKVRYKSVGVRIHPCNTSVTQHRGPSGKNKTCVFVTTHQMICLGSSLAVSSSVQLSGLSSKHFAMRRTFPWRRWKFPMCLTGFFLEAPKLNVCLEIQSLSSWNEHRICFFFFFILAEQLTVQSMVLVLLCLGFKFICNCTSACQLCPSCDSHFPTYSLMHFYVDG